MEKKDEFVIPNKENLRKQFEDETGKKYMFSNDSFYPLADYYLSYSEWLEKQIEFYSVECVKEKIDCKKRIKEVEETTWNAAREMDTTLHIEYPMWEDIEHWRKWLRS